MDPTTLTVVVAPLALLVVLGLLWMLVSRRRRAQRLQLAEQHLEVAQRQLFEVDRRKADALAAERRAGAASREAEQAEARAREVRADAQMREAEVEDRIRAADSLDPRVDHEAADYAPDPDRLHAADHPGGTHPDGRADPGRAT